MSNLYTSFKTIVVITVLSVFVSNVKAAVQPTYTPAPGVLYGLETVEMKFSGKTISILDASKIYFAGHSEIVVSAGVPFTDPDILALVFDKIRTAGTYELVVDAGAISINGTPNEEAYSATYQIKIGGNWKGEVYIDPEPGTVESLHQFKVFYSGASDLSVGNSAGVADFPKVYKLNKSGGRGEYYSMMGNTYGNFLSISLMAEITAPGNYELLIPATYLDVDGERPEREFSFFYTIEGDTGTEFDYSYAVTPDNSHAVNKLKVITVDFQGVSNIKAVGSWPNTPSFLQLGADGQKDSQVGMTYKLSGTSMTFTMGEYSQIEEAGKYKLVIPEAFLQLTSEDGASTMYNNLIEIVYDFDPLATDIVNVVVKEPKEGVYNVNGVRLPAAIGTLPQGVYIVNGKKTYIR